MRYLRLRLLGLASLVVASVCALLVLAAVPWAAEAGDYVVVDTGQTVCYDDTNVILCPQPGQAFYGQDAQYDRSQSIYTVSGDGLTVYDNNTGLTWQKDPDLDGDSDIDADDKLTWAAAGTYAATLSAANYGGPAECHLLGCTNVWRAGDRACA